MSDPEDTERTIGQTVRALTLQDWAVCADFLGVDGIAALHAEAAALHTQGAFHTAGVGQDAAQHEDIRRDQVLWLEGAGMPHAQRFLRGRLEDLRQAINAATYLGLYEFEGHYAVYPPGAFYARHLDQFQQSYDRLISVVLYLNTDWTDEDGGELHLYVNGPDGEEVVSVSPQAGTLVCFLSGRIFHEVVPARRMRLSLTGWFHRRR